MVKRLAFTLRHPARRLDHVQEWVDFNWEVLLQKSRVVDVCQLPEEERFIV